MKRFWISLLSLWLIMAFGTVVFAADAKFNGQFYLQGWYNKNASLIDKDSPAGPGNRGSSAFYTQRLRMGIDLQVAKGLRLSTRFDALERKWMAARRTAPTGSPGYGATDSEAENIAFDVAYVQFFTPIGLFTIGNVPSGGAFGTDYGEAVGFQSGVMVWTIPKGPWMVSATLKKSTDGYLITSSPTGTAIGAGTDNDSDTYSLALTYKWASGAFGTAVGDVRSRTSNVPHPGGTVNYVSRKTDIPYFNIWIQQRFGKIFVEDEFGMCHFGRYVQWNTPFTTYSPTPSVRDVDADFAVSNFFNINIDLAPAKLGFMFIYSRGDDPETMDKKEGGFRQVLDIDRSFNPCLILFNEDYMHWMGASGTRGATQQAALLGNAGSTNGINTYVQNVWLYQVYGHFDVTPKAKIGASFTYAYADQKPTANGFAKAYGGVEFLSDKYGSELDVTFTYKIYDNLEYMIGAAYLWTGDYFKGTNDNVKLSDTYLVTHKLTLTF